MIPPRGGTARRCAVPDTERTGRYSEAKYHEGAPEIRVVAQRRGQPHRAEPFTGLGQAGGKSNRRPSADTGQHGDILLAVVHVGNGITYDPRWAMHLVQNLSIAHIHGAEPSVESAVKGHTAGGGQHTAPILEPVIDCPFCVSSDRIESNESSANIRRGGVHIQNSADEREPGLILHVEGLIIHAYVIGWNIEQVRRRIVRCWLLILI